jgi:hypothetical protein
MNEELNYKQAYIHIFACITSLIENLQKIQVESEEIAISISAEEEDNEKRENIAK